LNGTCYLWELKTGKLIRKWDAHYKKVNCIQFTVDDVYFVTGCEDGSCLVWSFMDIVKNEIPTSVVALSSHSLAITDIYVGFSLYNKARCFTVSLDRTCKIWRLGTGELLSTIVFDRALTSIIVNITETVMYCGSMDGVIACSNLYKQDYTPLANIDHQEPKLLQKHTDRIRQVQFCRNQTRLVSCSDDGTCNVWDPITGQVLGTYSVPGKSTPLKTCLVYPEPNGFETISVKPFARQLSEEVIVDRGAICPKRIHSLVTSWSSSNSTQHQKIIKLMHYNNELRKLNRELLNKTI
jgi:pre-rRNA-processing protein IPI3